MKNFVVFIFLVPLLFPFLSEIKANQKSAQIVLFPVAEEPATEEPWSVATMVFTEEEAENVIERIQAERREAERQRRAALVNRGVYSASFFRRAGRISWGGWSWTWYSERIIPGHGLRIPGRHTDADGYVRDGNGYFCLASDVLRKGTIIETPFGGYGKVYDCGCGSLVDVYVNW